MTDDRELVRTIEVWLADGPDQMPDRVLLTVADEIERERQRAAWRLRWRSPDMPMLLRAAAGVAILALVVFAGSTFLPGRGGGPGAPAPAPTPTSSPTPSASSTPAGSIACEDDIPGCAGRLAAGEHASRQFEPPIRFAVPAGWTNAIDATHVYKLDPDVTPGSYLIAWSQAEIAEECTPAAKPALGHAPQDFVDYLTTHPGLETSTPVPIARGGYQGQALDVWIRSEWVNPCPEASSGLQFIFAGGNDAYWYGVGLGQRMHLEIADVAGTTVIFQVYGSPEAGTFASDIAPARAIIESMAIDAP